MALGQILVPGTRLEAAPATLDARGNAALAIAEYLRGLVFLRDGGDAAPAQFQLAEVLDEWPEPDRQLQYPSASLIDAEDVPASAHSTVPTPLEGTFDAAEGCLLWKVAEAGFTFQLDVWATDNPTREALAAGLPAAFAPGESNYGVFLAGSPRYHCAPVRASLLSWRRLDVPETVYPRERRMLVRLRAEVDVLVRRRATVLDARVELCDVGETVEVDGASEPATC